MIKRPQIKTHAILATATLALAACGKTSGSGLSDIPAVAPLVLSSLPASLQATASTYQSVFGPSFLEAPKSKPIRIQTADTAAAAAVAIMFKSGSYGKISGGNGSGYINALLEDLDYRMDEIKTRFSETAPNCFSGTPVANEFNLSAVTDHTNTVADALKLSLDLQCRDLFNTGATGEMSGTGSGMVFGKNAAGTDYSLGLVLNEKDVASSAFGYVAKVTGKGTDSETVDVIFGEGRPSGSSNGSKALVARVRAKPQSGFYEMMLASPTGGTTNPVSGGTAGFGCGFRGVTNGTLVYMAGTYNASGACSSSSGDNGAFAVCLTASDLSSTTLASCDTLKASMTIVTESQAADFNYTKVTTADSETIFNGLQFDTTAIDTATSETDE